MQKYQTILIQEWEQRQKRNPSYSLRALARDLEISPSSLSRVLAGEQGLSVSKAKEIAEKLSLSEEETTHFCSLVEAEHGRSTKARTQALKRLKSGVLITELSLEYFKIISDWHHYAIVELTEVKNFNSTPKWIAQSLGISVSEVSASIERLLKLEILTKTRDGSLKKTAQFRTTPAGIPNRALKNHHQQHLKKAEEALYEQSVQERNFSNVTFSMDQKDLEWAVGEMTKFRHELAQRLSSKKNKNRLYQLSMQLFALDQLSPQEK